MQGRRRPQPSGTNRPSSYPHHRAPGRPAWVSERSSPVGRPSEDEVRPSLCGPQGTRNKGRIPGGRSAAHRSAAIACGARPVPFRTRKLSRTAPMVLRGKPVGEQGAADRWTALRARRGGLGVPWPPRALSGARGPPFHVPVIFDLLGPVNSFTFKLNNPKTALSRCIILIQRSIEMG